MQKIVFCLSVPEFDRRLHPELNRSASQFHHVKIIDFLLYLCKAFSNLLQHIFSSPLELLFKGARKGVNKD
jgi:hypothetical protein